MGELPDHINALSKHVVDAALAVHSAVGMGYAEAVYEEALCIELETRSLAFQRQFQINLTYRGRLIGVHRLDLLVGGSIIIELKSAEVLSPAHFSQLLSYLRSSKLPLGLLINFNVPHLRGSIRRVINSRALA